MPLGRGMLDFDSEAVRAGGRLRCFAGLVDLRTISVVRDRREGRVSLEADQYNRVCNKIQMYQPVKRTFHLFLRKKPATERRHFLAVAL